jgi:predicted nuclease of restriction endonuclease-like RecB superfamily
VLTKDLLRVSRREGGYRPQFTRPDDERLAARVIGVFQGHVDRPRSELRAALTAVEREAEDFKLVRGFAKLLEREATFETRAAVDPERARETAFRIAAERGVVTETERAAALDATGERLGVSREAVESSLYADLDERQVLAAFDARWDPPELCAQYDLSLAQTKERDHSSGIQITPENLTQRYNLSLAQTALFDATEARIRSSDPRTLVSAVKWLGLMYEIQKEDGHWEVVVTGPDSLFRSTRRYGTVFARLLRTVAKASEWELTATIDDHGTERTMRLSDEDPIEVPDSESTEEVSFDSDVEASFATRFEALDPDWDLVREPEPLEVGASVMIPDFAFDYRYADFRVFFEIMGFWTPDYVEKKLGQLETVEDVEMLVAVDKSLGVSEEIEARNHRAITYSSSVSLKDVRATLRHYEDQLVTEAVSELPDELRPDADAITFEELAAEYGVSETALEDVTFPEHELVGRTLVRPAVLDELGGQIETEMALSEVKELFAEYGMDDASAALSELGYSVEWNGLSGGTVRRKK